MANEKRLIDANSLYLGKFVYAGMSVYKNGWNDALDAAATQADTVDAVEVVRCKDCKHCYESSGSASGFRCHCWGMWGEDHPVEPNGFCHIGERKDNG